MVTIPAGYTLQQTCSAYSATATTNATIGTTTCQVYLYFGYTYTMSVCANWDSAFAGDTYLRLVGASSGLQVAFNDNGAGCASGGSTMTYTPTVSGSYNIIEG